jgi:hypothetical protein
MVSVDQGQVQLYSTAAGGATQLSQNIKKAQPGGRVVLETWIKTDNISNGPKKWNKGRVLLLQYQQGKPQYKATHVLTFLKGTSDWTKYRATFPILPGAFRGRWKPALTVLAISGIIVGATLPGTLRNELKVDC